MDKEFLELTKLVSGILWGFIIFILSIATLYWRNYVKLSHVKRTADSACKDSKEALDKSVENEIIGKAIIERLDKDVEHRNEICKLKHEAVNHAQLKTNEILQEHSGKLGENTNLMQRLEIAITALTTEIKYLKPKD